MNEKWYITNHLFIFSEDNSVGRSKKEIEDASETQIDAILADYEISSPSELGKADRPHIQKYPRILYIVKRKNRDILFLLIRSFLPTGNVPPIDRVTLCSLDELEPYLREFLSKGWKFAYELPHIGPFMKG